MRVHPLTHASLDNVTDDSQRTMIAVLRYLDVMADEAAHKANHAQDARRVAYYLGIAYAMQMTHGEIARLLESLLQPHNVPPRAKTDHDQNV